MTLTDIASSLSASLGAASFGQTDRARTSASSDAVTGALTRASDRLEQQQTSTQVRLSAFGQIRSAVDQLQSSSQALTDGQNTNTDEEATQAAQNFVNAFNNAREVTNRAVRGDGESAGVLSDDGRALVAASELSRTFDNSTSSALRDIGINTNRDGTLNIDQQRFEQSLQNDRQAVTDTLSSAGQRVEQSTSRQLESSSSVNRSIENLNSQARNLEAQQSEQQALVETFQRSTEQANDSLNAISASGVAAYQKIFAL